MIERVPTSTLIACLKELPADKWAQGVWHQDDRYCLVAWLDHKGYTLDSMILRGTLISINDWQSKSRDEAIEKAVAFLETLPTGDVQMATPLPIYTYTPPTFYVLV